MTRPVFGGRYELGPAIGSGGFGTVFRARDRRTGSEVAVKLVLPGLGSELAAERLRREGRIVQRVTSRHVARVFDAGDDESGAWLVTELVEGAPLTVTTLGRRLLPHEVLRVARGLLEGLAAVHAAEIVHGDVKPSNVLVPFGDSALDGAKLVDFGLARVIRRSEVAESIGDAMTREGSVFGTVRYMAPEVLLGGEPTARSDLYSAGLVLFELLDEGPLFPVGDGSAQLRARASSEPSLGERVPQPLSDVLTRMLACDPTTRWPDARAAHEAVLDLDTAPVSLVRKDSLFPSGRVTALSQEASSRPVSRMSHPPLAHPTPPPASNRPVSESRGPASSAPPIGRLTKLPPDAVIALRETLRHLDLPMLDALARRERGHTVGRIARAVALALRLELDAAALILEPLAIQSDLARAIGAAVVAPRARRVTRARVDSDREDRWIETLEPELAAMLVALATALGTREDAPRDADRCARALVRLDAVSAKGGMPLAADATRTTLRIAYAAARTRRGELDRAVARDLLAPFFFGREARCEAAYHVIVRALCAAALSNDADEDEALVLAPLERAQRIAAETGVTLLDASAATALGMLREHQSPRDERGLRALERAGTLLARGDAPSLEHDAEQHRGTLHIALGRWADAIIHLRAAREAAHAERACERELTSASLEVLAELGTGNLQVAYEVAAVLGESRLAAATNRTAALAWIARALTSLAATDREGAEEALRNAEVRTRGGNRQNANETILVEILRILFDAAHGVRSDPTRVAAGLEHLAKIHQFETFYWGDLIGDIVASLPDVETSAKMADALARLAPFIGPRSPVARERRTDAPPSAAL